jgi:hypothetical protein
MGGFRFNSEFLGCSLVCDSSTIVRVSILMVVSAVPKGETSKWCPNPLSSFISCLPLPQAASSSFEFRSRLIKLSSE